MWTSADSPSTVLSIGTSVGVLPMGTGAAVLPIVISALFANILQCFLNKCVSLRV